VTPISRARVRVHRVQVAAEIAELPSPWDVDDLDQHLMAIGLVEEMVQGGVDPHPAPVLVHAAAAHLLSSSGRQHRYPALDSPRLAALRDLEARNLVHSVIAESGETGRESANEDWWALTDECWDLLGPIKVPAVYVATSRLLEWELQSPHGTPLGPALTTPPTHLDSTLSFCAK
jgi:hypothetical protein